MDESPSIQLVQIFKHLPHAKAFLAWDPYLFRIPILPFTVILRRGRIILRIVHPLPAIHAVLILPGMCLGQADKPRGFLNVTSESAVHTAGSVTLGALQRACIAKDVVVVFASVVIDKDDVSVYTGDFKAFPFDVVKDVLLRPETQRCACLLCGVKRIASMLDPFLCPEAAFFRHCAKVRHPVRLLLVPLQHVLFHDVAAVVTDQELCLLAQWEPLLLAEQTVLVEITYPEQSFSPPVFPVVSVVLSFLRAGSDAKQSDCLAAFGRLFRFFLGGVLAGSSFFWDSYLL